jgi:glycosyl transferase family 25
MRVWLINLDRSPDRLSFMVWQALRAGMGFVRFPGLTPDTVPEHLRSQFAGTPLLPGEIGCYSSHLALYEKIVAEHMPCALILEDDVTLTPGMMHTVRAAVAAAPAGWDYLHFSAVNKRATWPVARIGRHVVCLHSRIPVNTAGYLISQSGARKMLAPGPRVRPIDQDIRRGWLRNLNVYGIDPPLVVPAERFPSTIGVNYSTKRNWSAGRMSDLYGLFWRWRRLGPVGAPICILTNLRLLIARRAKKTRHPGIEPGAGQVARQERH